ncbi:MAG: TetR/AcrR family transcriptional regulator, partial [Cyanobacteria bacterium P01_H01_bin.15]
MSAKAIAILRGAKEEFLARGYAAASMDRIAKRAKVSKATVYSHFQDKEALFGKIMQQLAEQRFQRVFHPNREELTGTPEEVLTRVANDALDLAEGEQEFSDFMRVIMGESGRFPELALPYVQNVAKPLLTALAEYFASCPELAIADPEATARVFAGTLVYFVILQEVLHGEQ